MIRLATVADAADVAAIYGASVAHTAASFELEPPTDAEMRRRIEETLRAHVWLVCEDAGRVAGYAYAGPHHPRAGYRWSVNTSVYVHEDWRRLGVARGLYASLLCVLTAQGYVNAYAAIALPNPASVALHEAAGFTAVGVFRHVGYKFGAWHDVGWWERSLVDCPASPAPTLDLTALLGSPAGADPVRSGEAYLRLPGGAPRP